MPWLSRFFGTEPLAFADLMVCVGVSLAFFIYLEAEKVFRQWWSRRRANTPAAMG